MFPDDPVDVFRAIPDRHEPTPRKQSCVVPESGEVELDELPDIDSVVIPDMTPDVCLPTREMNYYVNYAIATILFHPDMVGKTVEITYLALGGVLRSSDIAAIHDAITRLQQTVYDHINKEDE